MSVLNSLPTQRLSVYLVPSLDMPTWLTSDHKHFVIIQQLHLADIIMSDPASLVDFHQTRSSQMLILMSDEHIDSEQALADDILSLNPSIVEQARLYRYAITWKERNQLRSHLAATTQRVEALEVGSKALSELHDESQIFQRLVEIVAKELHSERVSILRVFPERGELQMIAAHGIPAEIVAKARPKIGEGIAGQCAALGEPIFVSNHKKYRDCSGGQVSGEEALEGNKDLPMSLTTPILVKG